MLVLEDDMVVFLIVLTSQ